MSLWLNNKFCFRCRTSNVQSIWACWPPTTLCPYLQPPPVKACPQFLLNQITINIFNNWSPFQPIPFFCHSLYFTQQLIPGWDNLIHLYLSQWNKKAHFMDLSQKTNNKIVTGQLTTYFWIKHSEQLDVAAYLSFQRSFMPGGIHIV